MSTVDVRTLLPYDVLSEELPWRERILEGLNRGLAHQSIMTSVQPWTRQLLIYLSMKHQFERHQRAHLVRLYFGLITDSSIESPIMQYFCRVFNLLTSNSALIDHTDLVLDWRPLYRMMRYAAWCPKRCLKPPSENKFYGSLSKTIQNARRFFADEAPVEILEELLPDVSAEDIETTTLALAFTCLFLPSRRIETLQVAVPWLFKIWQGLQNVSWIDMVLIDLFGRMARDQCGHYEWPKEIVDFMWTAALKHAELPIGGGGGKNGQARNLVITIASNVPSVMKLGGRSKASSSRFSMSPRDGVSMSYCHGVHDPIQAHRSIPSANNTRDKFYCLAEFFIYSSQGDLRPYEMWFQATETFHHPSNSGRWSPALGRFLCSLTELFKTRWFAERDSPDCRIPQDKRLTPATKSGFIKITGKVVFLALYGKEMGSLSAAFVSLQNLAYLDPEYIIPLVLESAYPALENLTQSHRTISTIVSLSQVASPMLQLQEVQGMPISQHLMMLLDLSLPGLDLNDPMKSFLTLMFITQVFSSVVIKHSTDLADWILRFIDRIVNILENMTRHSGANMENRMASTIGWTTRLIFGQLDEQVFDVVLSKLANWVETTTLPDVKEVSARLISALGYHCPRKVMKRLFHVCRDAIIDELDHGASSRPSVRTPQGKVSTSDERLEWYMSILSEMVTDGCEVLLEYKEDLSQLFGTMWDKCLGYVGYSMTARMMFCSAESLIYCWPKEARCVNPEQWASESWDSEAFWGKKLGPEDKISVTWHVPTEGEVIMAYEALLKWTNMGMNVLKRFLNGEESYDPAKLTKNLVLMSCCVLLLNRMAGPAPNGPVAPRDEDDDVVMRSSDNADNCSRGESESRRTFWGELPDEGIEILSQTPIHVQYPISDPADPRLSILNELRVELMELFTDLIPWTIAKVEDSPEAMKFLTQCIRDIFCSHGASYGDFSSTYSFYEEWKNFQRNPKCPEMPRWALVHKAAAYHVSRLRVNAYRWPRPVSPERSFEALVRAATSRYSISRKYALGALTDCLAIHRYLKSKVARLVLQALEPKFEEEDTLREGRLTGALLLLKDANLTAVSTRRWPLLPVFIKAIHNVPHKDKAEILDLISRAISEFFASRTRVPLVRTCNPSLATYTPRTEELEEAQKLRAKVLQMNGDARNKAVDAALEIVNQPDQHWRNIATALEMLRSLMDWDFALRVDMVEVMIKFCLSSQPAIRRQAFGGLRKICIILKMRGKQQSPRPYKSVEKSSVARDLLAAVDEKGLQLTGPYVDRVRYGWLFWPKEIPVHYPVPDREEPTRASYPLHPDDVEAYEMLRSLVLEETFLREMLVIASEERRNSQAQREYLELYECLGYLSLFQTLGPELLERISPHLERLADQKDNISSVRCSAEILAGLVRGSKHWQIRERAAAEVWMKAILEKAFESINPETLPLWEQFVRFALRHQDPRRNNFLLQLVLGACKSNRLTVTDAPFKNAMRIGFARRCLETLGGSRILPEVTELWHTVNSLPTTMHRYKLIRDTLGGLWSEIIQVKCHPARSRRPVSIFDSDFIPDMNWMIAGADLLKPMESLVQSIDESRLARDTGAEMEVEDSDGDARKLLLGTVKLCMAFLLLTLSGARVQGVMGVAVPVFLPKMMSLFRNKSLGDDEELTTYTSRFMELVANWIYPSSATHMLNSFILPALETPEYQRSVKVLGMLQVMFFKHLFLIPERSKEDIEMKVMALLEHESVEVRETAAGTLSGLVRCSRRQSVQSIRDFASDRLEGRLPTKSSFHRSGPKSEPSPAMAINQQQMLRRRHAGALALSSVISAFPYDIPPFLPDVLIRLCPHISDPSPINTTVRKTFSNFRRTHQDTWHDDKTKFTEDQLSELVDLLVSPSYYA